MVYSNRFMREMGLTVPILQAPIGSVASVDLVRAVGRAGAMGSLALTNMPVAQAVARVAESNGLGVPYFVNYLVCFGTEGIREVAASGVRAMTFSFGMDAGLVADVRRMGVRVGVQVGSLRGAELALAAEADFLIAQGIEAGGHVQSSTPLERLLPQVVAVAREVPVIAAGGIAAGAGIARAMRAGAQGVTMGTRYVATDESAAHHRYKQALVAAGAEDTAFTSCFDGGWPYAMHRVLRNSTLEDWEAAGCPAAPHRPGEGEVVAPGYTRYDDAPPLAGAEGDVLAACLYAGAGVGAIAAVEGAEGLTRRLWAEALAVMAA